MVAKIFPGEYPRTPLLFSARFTRLRIGPSEDFLWIRPWLDMGRLHKLRFCVLTLIKCVFKNLCLCGYPLLIVFLKTPFLWHFCVVQCGNFHRNGGFSQSVFVQIWSSVNGARVNLCAALHQIFWSITILCTMCAKDN